MRPLGRCIHYAGLKRRFEVVSAAKISIMDRELNVEGLLLKIIFSLVDHPNEVNVTSVTTEANTTFTVSIAPPDVGKVIGKSGRNARAPRELLSAIGVPTGRRYVLNILTGS
jgi:predicted RNA-binding protein YlqC (UPF0109 family)